MRGKCALPSEVGATGGRKESRESYAPIDLRQLLPLPKRLILTQDMPTPMKRRIGTTGVVPPVNGSHSDRCEAV